VIPKIIITSDGDSIENIVQQFATQYEILPSHQIVVAPEKDELLVEQIHQLQTDIKVSFSREVLVVLQGVDASSNEVQNSLLKSIEEDSERILFLLLVNNPARLIPTILSRCTLVNQKLNVSQEQPVDVPLDLFSFQNNTDVKKEEAVERIDQYIQFSKIINVKVLHYILTIRKLVIDNNMNPVLALDTILLFLTKTSSIKAIHENKK